MNTERRSRNPRSAAVSAEDQPQRLGIPAGTRWNQRRPTGPTCCGWCAAHTAALREDFAVALATIRPPEDCRRRLALRPGGTPQEISRGQGRASGRSPRLPPRTGHAPAGHRRSFWHRPLRSFSAPARRLGQIASPGSSVQPGPFLRCPAGARSHSARFPGAASAGADLPPANLLRCPSGTGTGRPRTGKGKPPAREWRSKPVRFWLPSSVLQLCKISARREDFPRSAAVCAVHQPQRVGRDGRVRIHRLPGRVRCRCGWSSADTAALLGLRLPSSVFIVSLWSIPLPHRPAA